MIDGLKLTLSGGEIRTLLDERILEHGDEVSRWTREQTRCADDATDEEPVLPAHICEHEAETHAWRARVLTFMRDHVNPDETYLLDAPSLEFGELLPPMPKSVAQEEFEQRTAVGFNLERLTKSVDRAADSMFGSPSTRDFQRYGTRKSDADDTIVEESDECIARRIDSSGGPEVIKVHRK